MSGREFAFDRSVMRGHRRQLQAAVLRVELVKSRPSRDARPDTSFLVEAVTSAAASISARDERIRHLEQHQDEVQDLVEQMKAELEELVRLHHSSEARAEAETERAGRAEEKVIRLEARVRDLENDLDGAMTDLHRIADVITSSLLTSNRA